MKAVGLKVLKNKLSEYVRLTTSAETVLVTDRETVVAELVPPRAEGRGDDPRPPIAQFPGVRAAAVRVYPLRVPCPGRKLSAAGGLHTP